MSEVNPGDAAPAFSMAASGGRTVSSEGLKGTPYLLYFYPKADTPGCTKQACGIQEALPALGKLKLTVIGVSPDAMPPIEKFAKKFSLEFPWPATPSMRWPTPMACGWKNPCTPKNTWAWSGRASWSAPMGSFRRFGGK